MTIQLQSKMGLKPHAGYGLRLAFKIKSRILTVPELQQERSSARVDDLS